MTYEQAVEFIESAAKFGSKLGLENIGYLLKLLGDPQKEMKFVHVAGTNGKGSVCSFIAHVLIEAGYRTGLFTSPYLERFTERIQVDFREIPDEKLVEYVLLLKDKIIEMTSAGKNHPTFFELNTAVSLLYFKDMNCDIAVLEVGLGGRLDSTNIIDSPVVSVITALGFDHMAILGNTMAEISYEKAGIIKPGRPVVVYGDNPHEAMDVIKMRSDELGSPFFTADFKKVSNINFSRYGSSFNYDGTDDIRISLIGRHQIKNAATAVAALKVMRDYGFQLTDEDIRKGLLSAKWPGRVETIHENPTIICDAAHNPQGASVLRKVLEEIFDIGDIVFVMGVMKDKDYEAMASEVLPGAKAVITVKPNWHRALDAVQLLETVKRHCKISDSSDTIEEGLEKAVDIAGKNGIICTFGSLYYIADVKRFVRERLIGFQGAGQGHQEN